MSAGIAITILVAYFIMLMVIGFFTSRNSSEKSFYNANRSAPWYLVAFGMVGVSLSGVTFISIPGEVGNSGWSYLMVVVGNCIGYIIIALILLPLFYKLNLISIYGWLDKRFGNEAHKIGSIFFLISQLIGASFRLFLIVAVLQIALFNSAGIPFQYTVIITLLLVWLYTFRGGIKTLIWTDTLQTIFMLLSLIITVTVVCNEMNWSIGEGWKQVYSSPLSNVFDFDWKSGHNSIKQLVAGIAITIAINGLDQNIMQKNLVCKSLKACKTNMFAFSILFLITNILFLALGVLLYIYAAQKGISIPERSDDLFPGIALNNLGLVAAICFLLGITAAAYSSVDSSLTSMTTSFCVDILKLEPKKQNSKYRIATHLGLSMLMCAIIIAFKSSNNMSVVSAVFKAVGFTYGPILGLFLFGLCTKYQLKNKLVPLVCIASPIISLIINQWSEQLLWGYKFGFEILLLNAGLCFIGLFSIREKTSRLV